MNLELGNNKRTWNIVCVIAVLVMMVIAIADLVMPKPTVDKEIVKRNREVQQMEIKLRKDQEELERLILEDSGLWQGAQEEVTPKILQEVSKLATANRVNLKSFRPQTPVSDGETIRAHFVILADAKFPDMAKFVRALESGSTKIGLNIVQLSSADQESDQVNATIGIVAFLKAPVVVKKRETPPANQASQRTTSNNPQGKETANGEKE